MTQSSPNDAHAHLGLGLTFRKRLVQAQKGKIRFHTEPGKGTRVRYPLPDS